MISFEQNELRLRLIKRGLCVVMIAIGSMLAVSNSPQRVNGQGAGRPVAAPTPAKNRDSRNRRAEQQAARERAERDRIQREADEKIARERERAERETAKEKAAREAAEAKRRELEALLPNGKINSVWTESAVVKGGALGLQIHLKFEVNNLKGFKVGAGAVFYKADGNELKDLNQSYTTTANQVYTGEDFEPSYVNSEYSDFVLFIPYEELHLEPGHHKLKLFTWLRAGDTVLARSQLVEFSVTAAELVEAKRVALLPRGKIESVRIDPNINYGGSRGMMIHFKLTFHNLKGIECQAVAFFYYANQEPLKGKGKFADVGGTLITVSDTFTPTLVAGYYEDLRLFMPYKEIRLPEGKHELKFFAAIQGKNSGYFTQSDWVSFSLTQN